MQRRTLLKSFCTLRLCYGYGSLLSGLCRRHHQSRDHAFALRDDGDFRNAAERRRADGHRRHQRQRRGAGQETGAGGGRPGLNWPLFAEKARQLLAQDKVAVVFGCWTSVSRKSVLPVFEELNGLLFYPGAVRRGRDVPQRLLYRRGA